jgi:hypothetical protein
VTPPSGGAGAGGPGAGSGTHTGPQPSAGSGNSPRADAFKACGGTSHRPQSSRG